MAVYCVCKRNGSAPALVYYYQRSTAVQPKPTHRGIVKAHTSAVLAHILTSTPCRLSTSPTSTYPCSRASRSSAPRHHKTHPSCGQRPITSSTPTSTSPLCPPHPPFPLPSHTAASTNHPPLLLPRPPTRLPHTASTPSLSPPPSPRRHSPTPLRHSQSLRPSSLQPRAPCSPSKPSPLSPRPSPAPRASSTATRSNSDQSGCACMASTHPNQSSYARIVSAKSSPAVRHPGPPPTPRQPLHRARPRALTPPSRINTQPGGVHPQATRPSTDRVPSSRRTAACRHRAVCHAPGQCIASCSHSMQPVQLPSVSSCIVRPCRPEQPIRRHTRSPRRTPHASFPVNILHTPLRCPADLQLPVSAIKQGSTARDWHADSWLCLAQLVRLRVPPVPVPLRRPQRTQAILAVGCLCFLRHTSPLSPVKGQCRGARGPGRVAGCMPAGVGCRDSHAPKSEYL